MRLKIAKSKVEQVKRNVFIQPNYIDINYEYLSVPLNNRTPEDNCICSGLQFDLSLPRLQSKCYFKLPHADIHFGKIVCNTIHPFNNDVSIITYVNISFQNLKFKRCMEIILFQNVG